MVLDGVTECYALHEWDINKATDAAEFQKLFNRFADSTASIAIDHSGKDAGRGVIGSQHKRAGLNGAEYAFTPTQRQGRGGHSVAEIEVTKDRHGYVREFAPDGRIGRLHVSDGKVEIVPPDPDKAGPGGDVRLRVAILKWIEAHPGGSGREVAKGVQRGDKTVNAELRLL